MKKIVIILAIIIGVLVIYKSRIPEESIRFRIIANSNTQIDQETKQKIIKVISEELTHKSKNIREEREYLKNQIPSINQKIKETIKEPYQIKYGENYFPEKEYKNNTYPEGEYESLVITLGEGKGDNFWCVLFPPLCMIEEGENVEYDSFLKKVWENLF
ncbi:MAG: stage II sporulation protein R [Bacilli bacterium]|nr:stage II sporulation protein R [Bacilli bacterium]